MMHGQKYIKLTSSRLSVRPFTVNSSSPTGRSLMEFDI